MAKRVVAVNKMADDALHVLGDQIRIARHGRGWTAADLGARIGVSARTVTAIEAGSPGSSVGSVFNAAATVGVDLFVPDRHELARMRRRGEEIVALIPRRTRAVVEDSPDDFDF